MWIKGKGFIIEESVLDEMFLKYSEQWINNETGEYGYNSIQTFKSRIDEMDFEICFIDDSKSLSSVRISKIVGYNTSYLIHESFPRIASEKKESEPPFNFDTSNIDSFIRFFGVKNFCSQYSIYIISSNDKILIL